MYYVSGLYLGSFKPFQVKSVIFPGLRTIRFPRCSHAGNVYIFCACVKIKKGGDSNIYCLDRKKIINLCDKMVIFNFKILLFTES